MWPAASRPVCTGAYRNDDAIKNEPLGWAVGMRLTFGNGGPSCRVAGWTSAGHCPLVAAIQ